MKTSVNNGHPNGVLHCIRTRGWLLLRETKRMLVEALETPWLDYACVVYNDIPAYLQLKVQRHANAGIRFIFNLRHDSSISPYRLELGWSTPASRRLYFLGCTAYSIFHKFRRRPLYNKLSPIFSNVRRSTRLNNAEIEVPPSRTSFYDPYRLSKVFALNCGLFCTSEKTQTRFSDIAKLYQ